MSRKTFDSRGGVRVFDEQLSIPSGFVSDRSFFALLGGTEGYPLKKHAVQMGDPERHTDSC